MLKRLLAATELAIGIIAVLRTAYWFILLAGIAQFEGGWAGVSFWAGLLFGPLALIAGGVLVLTRVDSRSGMWVLLLGVLGMIGVGLYESRSLWDEYIHGTLVSYMVRGAGITWALACTSAAAAMALYRRGATGLGRGTRGEPDAQGRNPRVT